MAKTKLHHLLGLALEGEVDGKIHDEIERVFYAPLDDLQTLKSATEWEDHDQWEIKLPKTEQNSAAGRMRVRKITYPDGRVNYVRTTKIKIGGKEKEVEAASSDDEFQMFRMLAPAGMVKRRFYFPIAGRTERWEVDVFKNAQGEFYRWVKIDLEIHNVNDLPPMNFPEGLIDETRVAQASDPEEEKKQLISELYQRVFLTTNPGNLQLQEA